MKKMIPLAFCIILCGMPKACADVLINSGASKKNIPAELIKLRPASSSLIVSILDEIPNPTVDWFLGNSGKRNSDQDGSSGLRNIWIRLDRVGKSVPKVTSTKTAQCFFPNKGPAETFYPVTRPSSSNFVAVVKTIDGFPGVLNPIQGFDYGPIPLLNNLTLREADELWSPDEPSNKDWNKVENGPVERHYSLISTNRNNETKKFDLFCTFCSGCLVGYEITGPGIREASRGPLDDRNYP